ncbi:hypothetical protein ADS77_21040 [Pseudoalteromonas porphyrae]|uniref:Uncharacterized protein n=1 Tax=Pseudoalteromonas porphyrae TaxID=187330 RepID=A0A0N1EJG7_9GAMM|nr:hypothetical protein ADS77_21040 [Pseudoalteromonas porphyrae]
MVYHHLIEKIFIYFATTLFAILVLFFPFAISYFAFENIDGIKINLAFSYGMLAFLSICWLYAIRLVYLGWMVIKTINATIDYNVNGVTITQQENVKSFEWHKLAKPKELFDISGLALRDSSNEIVFIISANAVGFDKLKTELNSRLNCT